MSTALPVYATPDQTAPICPAGNSLCNLQVDDHAVLIRNIINLLLWSAVMLAIIFVIYGGIKWVLSGGDKAKVDAARGTITFAIIGLTLSFLAFLIINSVLYFFGIQQGSIFVLPTLTNNEVARPQNMGAGKAAPTKAPLQCDTPPC